jgi:hypothetical protein
MAAPDWRTMPRTAFDTAAGDTQLALIPAPDPADTGDLYSPTRREHHP